MLPVPDPALCDGVVSLRPPEERDLLAIERGINDPDVIPAFGRPTLASEQLFELNRNRWNQDEGVTFAICDPGDRCLGHVFVNLVRVGRGNIGYWLLPEARGKGLATRAVLLVARWALRDLALARLGLLAEASNERSQQVAEHSGFQREGVLRSYAEIDGRRVDYVSFSLVPTDHGLRYRSSRGLDPQ